MFLVGLATVLRLCFTSDNVLLIDWLYCIDLFSCIAASVFSKLTYLLTYLLSASQTGTHRRLSEWRRDTNHLPVPAVASTTTVWHIGIAFLPIALHCSGVLYYINNIIYISYNVPFNLYLSVSRSIDGGRAFSTLEIWSRVFQSRVFSVPRHTTQTSAQYRTLAMSRNWFSKFHFQFSTNRQLDHQWMGQNVQNMHWATAEIHQTLLLKSTVYLFPNFTKMKLVMLIILTDKSARWPRKQKAWESDDAHFLYYRVRQ